VKVGAERREGLRLALERSGAQRREAKGSGEVWRYELDGAHVTLWRTGTVRVQGKGEGAGPLGRLVEEFAVPDAATVPGQGGGRSAVPLDLPRDAPWAGVDESGKGDYFGPLVSAAVVLTPEAAAELAALGVQDSKRLSDGKVGKLAPHVRALSEHALTTVAPPRYNTLYDQFRREGKRLNQLLAWAHVRSIGDLLDRGVVPAYAIVDQFADARVVEQAAETRTGGLRIVQFPRAEADIAVAAASVLARGAFLEWLDRAGERVGQPLPKGAGPQVIEAARAIVERHGADALATVAKLHFATTGKVLT
jgi:ribonuclease HIII